MEKAGGTGEQGWEEAEAWVAETSGMMAEELEVEPDLAEMGVRWALLWIEDVQRLIEASDPETESDLKSVLQTAFGSSLERLEGGERYISPSGVPAMGLVVVAKTTFITAFDGPTAKLLEELLNG